MEDWRDIEHDKVIIHIDLDCFYAQVEELLNPRLVGQPVGVQQKNILVTCNYKAREYGIRKTIYLSEAVKLCPKLVIVNGEDLTNYRQYSNKVHNLLLTLTPHVEKLGMDENYVDVTDLVKQKLSSGYCEHGFENISGNIYNDVYETCVCGCHDRLIVASQIASEIRNKIKSEIGLTSCAGVAHNKLLAKLVCSTHKPNQQTVLFPVAVDRFMLSFNSVSDIPGIGTKLKHTLGSLSIKTVEQLRNCNTDSLKNVLDDKLVVNLKNWAFGVDDSVVKTNSKPQSIGLEDSFKKLTLGNEVKDKFKVLLLRLLSLVADDGRFPITIKVTVRKYDSDRRMGHRETRQCPVPSVIFSSSKSGSLPEHNVNKLLELVMGLFHKMVNINKPLNLTLIGLAFTKFQEKCSGNKSIANFLIKERDISVQSLTSFVSDNSLNDTSSSCSLLNLSSFSPPHVSTSNSDQESEPFSKKLKSDLWLKKRKRACEGSDVCSPSKLKVSDLSLNSDHSVSMDGQMDVCDTENDVECPSNVDSEVFKQLPREIQLELIEDRKIKSFYKPKTSAKKQNLIFQYCTPNK